MLLSKTPTSETGILIMCFSSKPFGISIKSEAPLWISKNSSSSTLTVFVKLPYLTLKFFANSILACLGK